MIDVLKNQILDFGKALVKDKLAGENDSLSVRYGDGMLISPAGKPIGELVPEDIKQIKKGDSLSENEALHSAIYATRSDINAIITNHAPYCVGVARGCKTLPAALDDMAQIIGPSAKVAKSDKALDVLATLKGRNACLIRGGGVIATGRTLDEAHTGSMVLEKGAKAYVEATVLGGAVKIGLFDAALMRFVYKTKYSKKDQSEKLNEVKA